MNRWALMVGLAGLGFGLVAIAAPTATTEIVPISLPSASVSGTDVPANNQTVLAAATNTAVVSAPPIPVTLHQGPDSAPSVSPAPTSQATAPAKTTDINSIPLPPEFSHETAAGAMSGSHQPAPASPVVTEPAAAASTSKSSAAKAAKTTTVTTTSTPAKTATVTKTAPVAKQAVTPAEQPTAASAVTTSAAPGNAPIAPVSSTAAGPTSPETLPPATSLPLFSIDPTQPSEPTTTTTTITGAPSSSHETVPSAPTPTMYTSTTTKKVRSKSNAVSAQELAWRIDQPNPSKGPVAVPLMLTDPNPATTTITDAIRETLATHPQILQDFAEQLAAQQDINQAKGGLLPTLDLNAGIGPEVTNNPGTQASGRGTTTLTRKESQALMQQLLFDGGNVTNQIRQASATYEATAYELEQAKEILSFDAAEAYLNVIRQRQLVEVYSYDSEAHRILLGKITRRFEAGAGTKSDVELAKGRLAQALAQVSQSEGALATANDTYMRVIGVYPTVNMQKPLVPLHLPSSLTQAQVLGMAMSPNIQGSFAQIAAAQAAVGVAKSAFYPTVTANLAKHYDDNLAGVPGSDQAESAMVRANYNVFRGGSDVAAVSAANYRVTSAIDQSKVVQRDVAFAIAQAWNSLLSNLDQIRNLTIHQKQSYNVWQAYIKQFQLGQRTLWDMLNAQSEYYDAQVSVVNATYDAMAERYQLLASIGALVGTITNPEQDVFTRRPLEPRIMPGESHPQMVPQVGANVPPPVLHLPNMN